MEPINKLQNTTVISQQSTPVIQNNYPPPPNVPQIIKSDVPVKNRISTFKVIFIVMGIILTLFIIAGLTYLIFGKSSPINKINKTDPEYANNVQQINTKNNYIAYLYSNSEDKMLFDIYDPDTRQNLPFINPINNKYEFISIGKWSPDGKYLPIFAYNFNKENLADEPLLVFVFDVQNKQLKKIYESVNDMDRGTLAIWKESLKYGSPWINNNSLILEDNKDIINKISKLTYITINGELKTIEQPISPEIHEIKNKTLSILYKNPPDQDNPIISISYNNNLLPFNPGGKVVGIVNNKLAVLKSPKVLSLFDPKVQNINTSAVDKEIEDLKKQNLPPSEMQARAEELSKKYLELLEPKGKTVVELYDLINGNLTNTFTISDGDWWTDGIFVGSDKKTVIAHQTDKNILATKERFVKLNLSANSVLQTLVEYKLDPKREVSGYFQLVNGTPFYLTDDAKWIISFHEATISSIPVSDNVQIYIRNIETGEEVNICSNRCSTFSNYNSQILD